MFLPFGARWRHCAVFLSQLVPNSGSPIGQSAVSNNQGESSISRVRRHPPGQNAR